ncbi:HD family phosphohydrolase [Tautonia sociabilis]|uniref:HDIG domain-containing protein n=1 Tax=Tautonia sociabilis TaxID=2080755 RepID=A0A432MGZ0_9BACT|nr:HDIG domain-containing metalloprotein [Tautonia sociabilis]RUL86197.1 HDIG domain-containing protein [Tautonia sociabilis]
MTPGRRKPKVARAQLRGPELIDLRKGRHARQRRRLACLAPAIVAALVSAAIVCGSGPPFSYRVGQRATRDLRVNVPELRRYNSVQTNLMRDEAAKGVPPIFSNSPASILELQKMLEDLIATIADAKRDTVDALPADVVASWDLNEEIFDDLREASDTPERREGLRRAIAEAFAPIIRHGVLGRDLLPLDEESGTMIQVVLDDGDRLFVNRDRVLPDRLVRPDYPVAEEFVAAFTSPELGKTLFELVSSRLAATTTLHYEKQLTDEARALARSRVDDWYDTSSRGQLLVEKGDTITEEQLEWLRLDYEATLRAMSPAARLGRVVAFLLIVSAVYGLIGATLDRYEPRIARDPTRVAVFCGVAVVALGLARLMALRPWGAELIPIALASMLLAVAYTPLTALVFTVGASLLVSLALGTGLASFIMLLGGTATAILMLGEVRTRTKPILVGASAAVGYAILSIAAGLWQDQPSELILSDSALRAGWGLLTGFLLGGSLPFVERGFGIVTGISLLELGDVNHPLLQELVRRAPGTHNHSITVGTIAEAAAEKVGADGLLVRVGAYFHDIGKMLKPHYFVENQTAGAVNRHANLAPAMSTLIIIGHVKDGAELARQHGLPPRIIDLIEQHHGTTLVEYFYHEANRRRDGDPDAPTILESTFRYPGPKPQTKEAAILMMADASESASRALSDPAPSRLEGLVTDLIDKRLRDGQFDQCDLTLREIALVRESIIKSLIGIYHGRVKYPEQRTA